MGREGQAISKRSALRCGRFPKMLVPALLCIYFLRSTQGATSYFLVKQSLTWVEALTYCRTQYTDLASIESDSELMQVSAVAILNEVWVGLFLCSPGAWRWSAGNALENYTKWNSGKPSLTAYSCGRYKLYKWNDGACDSKFYFVCYKATNTTVPPNIPATCQWPLVSTTVASLTDPINESTPIGSNQPTNGPTNGVSQQSNGMNQQNGGGNQQNGGGNQQTNGFSQQANGSIQQITGVNQLTNGGVQQVTGVNQQNNGGVQQVTGVNQQTNGGIQQTDDVSQQTDDVSQQTDDVSQQTDDVSQQTDDVSQQTDDVSQQTDDVSQQTDGSSIQSPGLTIQKRSISQVSLLVESRLLSTHSETSVVGNLLGVPKVPASTPSTMTTTTPVSTDSTTTPPTYEAPTTEATSASISSSTSGTSTSSSTSTSFSTSGTSTSSSTSGTPTSPASSSQSSGTITGSTKSSTVSQLWTGPNGAVSGMLRLVLTPMSWLNARLYCRSNFTDMAAVLSQLDQNNVAALLSPYTPSTGFWIGLRFNRFKSNWYWSGRQLWGGFSQWGPGEPDTPFTNACGMISGAPAQNFTWGAKCCGQELPFICYKGS